MKNLTVIIVVALMFAAQATQAQWVVAPVLPEKATLPASSQPMVLPTLMKATLGTAPVDSKELWLGNASLSFHVEARELLQVVQGTSLIRKIARSQFLMRMALHVILQENNARPLDHQMRGARLIQKSA